MNKAVGILLSLVLLQSFEKLEAQNQNVKAALCVAGIIGIGFGIATPIKIRLSENQRVLSPRESQLLGDSLKPGDVNDLKKKKTYFVEKTWETSSTLFKIVSNPYDLGSLSYPDDTVSFGSLVGKRGSEVGHFKLQFRDSKKELVFTLGDLALTGKLQIFDLNGKVQYEIETSGWRHLYDHNNFKFKNRDGYVVAEVKVSDRESFGIFNEAGDLVATLTKNPVRANASSWRVDVFDPAKVPIEIVLSMIAIED